MLYDQIYAEFLQHCRRGRPPGSWRRFAECAKVWTPPKDVSAALTALQEKYALQDLLRSGVVTYGDVIEQHQNLAAHCIVKKVVINPVLDGPSSQILPLRVLPESNPFDLITAEGTLSRQLPACAMLHDHLTQKGIQKAGMLCLTFSLPDLIVFRAVGLPAVLATGLANSSGKILKEFAGSLGLDVRGGLPGACREPTAMSSPISQFSENPANGEPDSSACPPATAGPLYSHCVRPQLFLVDWTPANVSHRRPDEFDAVLRKLANVSDYLGFSLDDAFVWRPAAQELRQIAYCVSNGSRKDVRRALLASLRHSAKLVAQSTDTPKPQQTLLEARARLRKALLRAGGNSDEVRRRLREYQRAIHETFVAPLMESAVEEPDLQKRSQLAALASINQMLHTEVEFYLAIQAKAVTHKGLRSDSHDSGLRDLLKMFDILFRFAKQDQ